MVIPQHEITTMISGICTMPISILVWFLWESCQRFEMSGIGCNIEHHFWLHFGSCFWHQKLWVSGFLASYLNSSMASLRVLPTMEDGLPGWSFDCHEVWTNLSSFLISRGVLGFRFLLKTHPELQLFLNFIPASNSCGLINFGLCRFASGSASAYLGRRSVFAFTEWGGLVPLTRFCECSE
jgi:hypothetical protein